MRRSSEKAGRAGFPASRLSAGVQIFTELCSPGRECRCDREAPDAKRLPGPDCLAASSMPRQPSPSRPRSESDRTSKRRTVNGSASQWMPEQYLPDEQGGQPLDRARRPRRHEPDRAHAQPVPQSSGHLSGNDVSPPPSFGPERNRRVDALNPPGRQAIPRIQIPGGGAARRSPGTAGRKHEIRPLREAGPSLVPCPY